MYTSSVYCHTSDFVRVRHERSAKSSVVTCEVTRILTSAGDRSSPLLYRRTHLYTYVTLNLTHLEFRQFLYTHLFAEDRGAETILHLASLTSQCDLCCCFVVFYHCLSINYDDDDDDDYDHIDKLTRASAKTEDLITHRGMTRYL